MRKSILIFALLAVSLTSLALADDKSAIATDDHGDPVLKAMLTELRRSQEKLQLGEMQRPYYIDYQVTELRDFSAEATLGALRGDHTNLVRVVRVVVRIGDYKQDSYYGEGVGTVEGLPIDNQEMALRRQLWLATDKAYKSALGGLSEKQAALKNLQTESEVADFAQEKPTPSVHEPAKLDLDFSAWKQRVRANSDLFRRDPSLDNSSAFFNVRVLNRYYVNTEGAITRNGKAVYTYGFSGSAQADDAMRLERSQGYVVTRPEELPKPEEAEKDTQRLIATFAALRKAPLAEDEYRGPVLFSADAATALFERLIVPNVLGIRPELGNSARTRGDFASAYKSRVLPDFFTVVDDPRSKKIDGQTLAGSYDVDDEGTAAQTVTVIDKGVLTNYLLGREPIRDFPHSNGHGRTSLAGPPRSQISNLIFSAANGVSFEELKKKLIAMCKDQGRPYGYYVETTGPQLTPRLLWRVYVNDGHMELVRGAVFHLLDTRALRTGIVAAGNDVYVYNRSEPLPSSIVAPSLLFDELEIQRSNRTKEKLPNYPAPALAAK
ncbi:MAG: peptidase U62 [Acidobacteriia bacterium]|nr:peptidase U62 [Terriglobia bacterium]